MRGLSVAIFVHAGFKTSNIRAGFKSSNVHACANLKIMQILEA
jgi:hypothetical protein